MVDDADRAQDEIDLAFAQARSAAQARQMLIPTGHCHNCDEPVRGGPIVLRPRVHLGFRKTRTRNDSTRTMRPRARRARFAARASVTMLY
jgi:hypothetical protein